MKTTYAQPCPICPSSNTPHLDCIEANLPVEEGNRVQIVCQKCGFASPASKSEAGAIAVWNSVYRILTEKFIVDDEGCRWLVENGKVRMIEADLDFEDGDDVEENGYGIPGGESSRSDGYRMLKEFGYIS